MPSNDPRFAGPRSLASLTKYIAHEGIAHAGGQYVLHHYAALRDLITISEIAPDTPRNRHAMTLRTDVDDIELVTGPGLFRGGRFKQLGDLESAWSGSAVTQDVRRTFASDAAPWPLLERAAGIELHWSELMALAPAVRRRLPHARLVGIAHDVITQRWARAAETSSWPVSLAYRVAADRSRARERESFAALDLVIAFSEKDAALVREISPHTRAEVVLPGLGPAPGEMLARTPDVSEPVVLFTGALSRPDNHEAVTWFLTEVWPSVLARVPSARFVAAGAHPKPALEKLVARSERATLTGYVDSLEPYYASASVFVAPIFNGAGVKFKTIDALLRSVPVVATDVGAEGIANSASLLSVANSPGPFSDLVADALTNPDDARTTHAAAWANDTYGNAAFTRRLRDLYSDLGIIG
ncbi:glycosyltransferase [Xylanimonas protaetiae]|nr:glycosyltransferase [Xylanimonas protaetiae]